ncbi:MAG: cytochrome c [Firmicutes bacterium]|nr:cytochrome c [Bacillota bacterium]
MKYFFVISVAVVLLSFFALTGVSLFTLKTPEISPAVVAGKKVWQKYGCAGCHSLLGMGAYLASDLTYITRKHDHEWIYRFFARRPVMPPSKKKRHPGLSRPETADIFAFFTFVAGLDTQQWPPKPMLSEGERKRLEQSGRIKRPEIMPEIKGGR